MLTCALLVWVLHPENFDSTQLRNTFLTEQECIANLNDNFTCIKIDKRYNFTEKEWQKDNCSISEHKWKGTQ